MQAERRSIATATFTRSAKLSSLPGSVQADLERTLMELGKLAMSRQLSLTTECLLLMAQDLADLPWPMLDAVITGWRKGTLRIGRPEQMDRFPTVRQLRVQTELLRLEGLSFEDFQRPRG